MLIVILLGAALLASLIGDLKDAAVIAFVVLLNAGLGFFQEYRAENALEALKDMLSPTARVRRGWCSRMIPAEELVPGDIVLLEAGDRVPAEARVLQTHAAEVVEAALTGESHAVGETTAAVATGAPLAERVGMVFMNTVTRSRIEAIVTATGMQTEMGRLADLLAETAKAATPLQVQGDVLGKRLALIATVVDGLMFAVGLARGDDRVTTIAVARAALSGGSTPRPCMHTDSGPASAASPTIPLRMPIAVIPI